jgi:hypothetical protein
LHQQLHAASFRLPPDCELRRPNPIEIKILFVLFMVAIQRLVGPAALSSPSPAGGDARWSSALSVMSYNVLLPNSVDGWWHYKMYLPPLDDQTLEWSTWEYRKKLLRDRISAVDADVVCLQEVAPVSFESDFDFMAGLGYDGREMFKKGRFRPATFWKTSRLELASDPVHKDRTLLTAFRHRPRPAPTDQDDQAAAAAAPSGDAELGPPRVWYVLNCHLQAGREGQRRVRQINEAVRSVLTLARKLKGTTFVPRRFLREAVGALTILASCVAKNDIMPRTNARAESRAARPLDCVRGL